MTLKAPWRDSKHRSLYSMRAMSTLDAALHIAIRCDGLRHLGVGHLVRQSALMEELLGRGHRVQLVGDIDVPWLRHEIESLAVPIRSAEGFLDWVTSTGIDVVMIDGYEFAAELGRKLQQAGIAVATMVDANFGAHQVADLYVDQNVGAVPGASGRWLVGPDYTLLRDIVVRRRGLVDVHGGDPASSGASVRKQAPGTHTTPRVLILFGGTDPFRGSPVALELLFATGEPVHAVVIAADPEVAELLSAITPGTGQQLEVLGPQTDLPAVAITCQAAISAAGSSVWELACLGLPSALVCVTDNQRQGYLEATRGLALGVGYLDTLRHDAPARSAGIEQLQALVTNPSLRAQMSYAAARLIDGRGRARVVDALEALVH